MPAAFVVRGTKTSDREAGICFRPSKFRICKANLESEAKRGHAERHAEIKSRVAKRRHLPKADGFYELKERKQATAKRAFL